MSYSKDQGVTYMDHEGNNRGAIVITPHNERGTADVLVVTRDESRRQFIDKADFDRALDRVYDVEDANHKAQRIAKERQAKADETGVEQDPVDFPDLRESIFNPTSGVRLPAGSFTPKPKEEAVADTGDTVAAAVGAGASEGSSPVGDVGAANATTNASSDESS
jgi:hypothetical protein